MTRFVTPVLLDKLGRSCKWCLLGLEFISSMFIGQRIRVHDVHRPPYSSVIDSEFNPEYGHMDFFIWLRKPSCSPKYILYGNFLRALRMWRHLLEMRMFFFIMLVAKKTLYGK